VRVSQERGQLGGLARQFKRQRGIVPPQSEESFQQGVIDLARALSWHVYHTRDSRRSAHGFPDLVLCRPPRLVIAELKSDRGHLTPEQDAWLRAFGQVPGIEVFVWTPRDKEDIVAVLVRRVSATQSAPAHVADGTQCWCCPDVVYQDGSHESGPCLPGEAIEGQVP
jgi:VRR-NUC domain